jgi:hypothetical protein
MFCNAVQEAELSGMRHHQAHAEMLSFFFYIFHTVPLHTI